MRQRAADHAAADQRDFLPSHVRMSFLRPALRPFCDAKATFL
jgi:hypothetical protein